MNIEEKVCYINKEIEREIEKETAEKTKISKAEEHLVLRKSKRYRPLLTMSVYEMLGGNFKNARNSAVGIEYLHSSSLILDDLPCMDNAEMRRGEKTVHCMYGENTAILTAFSLFNKGRELIAQDIFAHPLSIENRERASKFLSDSISKMLYGQELDLKQKKTDKELRDSIFQKNRAIHFSCVFPYHLLKKSSACRETLDKIGVDLSFAYQLFDDLRDVRYKPQEVGKPTLVEAGKRTTVYRWGEETVEKELEKRKKRIIKNLRAIQKDSELEWLVEQMLSAP
ncbi:MAG: polyprenyl synthetase family protein [Nanoarchaeota archaeon]